MIIEEKIRVVKKFVFELFLGFIVFILNLFELFVNNNLKLIKLVVFMIFSED